MKNSCKGCPKRHPGCHSDCESYAQYRKKIDAWNEHKEKERKLIRLLYWWKNK